MYMPAFIQLKNAYDRNALENVDDKIRKIKFAKFQYFLSIRNTQLCNMNSAIIIIFFGYKRELLSSIK